MFGVVMVSVVLWFVLLLLVSVVFFFFKQKTAYEMRISDWSSDVCSSDLHEQPLEHSRRRQSARPAYPARRAARRGEQFARSPVVRPARPRRDRNARGSHIGARRLFTLGPRPRSEEHTSELQSLMRSSYAVFCLKKKNTHNYTPNNTTSHYTQP